MNYIQMMIVTTASFIITLISGPIIIPILQRLKVGQSIRDEGPKSHMSKSGTPTMGGLMMIVAVGLTTLTAGLSGEQVKDLYVMLFAMVAFGLIGFVDDFIKVVLKRNLGLRAYQKLIGQVIIALILAIYFLKTSAYKADIYIPFINMYIDFGILYIPFIVVFVVGTTNSVNLTDGLDGLASGVTLIVAAFFTIVSSKMGMPSVTIFCGALTGACLGFLKFNAYPAKVFMGDTGSMALGGAIAAVSVLTNLTMIIPIVGGIYFAEALSVIIQVTSFKLTGKRVFKMSPLHHHYELCGWKETKVVMVFWLTTLILCIIGLFGVRI